jgi:ABC-2 type transport system permease protein
VRNAIDRSLRPLQLFWLFLRIGALNELQYRANFFVQIFQSAIALLTGLAVLALVFSHTPELNGWTQAELLAVMGVHILMGGAIATSIQPNMQKLMEDVQRGTFDFVVIKPEDAQVLSSVREVRIWSAVDILVGFVVLGVAISLLGAGVGLGSAVAFAIALLIGGLLIYCFWLIITTGVFWFVRMGEIAELFEGVYQSGRWPVTIYPGWLRISLTYIVPIAFAVTVPAQAVTGRLTLDTLAIAAGFAVLLLLFTRWFFRFGMQRYAGASA